MKEIVNLPKRLKDKAARKRIRRRFDKWKLSKAGRLTLESMWFEQDRRCAKCKNEIILSEFIPASQHKYLLDKLATVDHIIPVAYGGTRDRRNLRLLCHNCNNKRGV